MHVLPTTVPILKPDAASIAPSPPPSANGAFLAMFQAMDEPVAPPDSTAEDTDPLPSEAVMEHEAPESEDPLEIPSENRSADPSDQDEPLLDSPFESEPAPTRIAPVSLALPEELRLHAPIENFLSDQRAPKPNDLAKAPLSESGPQTIPYPTNVLVPAKLPTPLAPADSGKSLTASVQMAEPINVATSTPDSSDSNAKSAQSPNPAVDAPTHNNQSEPHFIRETPTQPAITGHSPTTTALKAEPTPPHEQRIGIRPETNTTVPLGHAPENRDLPSELPASIASTANQVAKQTEPLSPRPTEAHPDPSSSVTQVNRSVDQLRMPISTPERAKGVATPPRPPLTDFELTATTKEAKPSAPDIEKVTQRQPLSGTGNVTQPEPLQSSAINAGNLPIAIKTQPSAKTDVAVRIDSQINGLSERTDSGEPFTSAVGAKSDELPSATKPEIPLFLSSSSVRVSQSAESRSGEQHPHDQTTRNSDNTPQRPAPVAAAAQTPSVPENDPEASDNSLAPQPRPNTTPAPQSFSAPAEPQPIAGLSQSNEAADDNILSANDPKLKQVNSGGALTNTTVTISLAETTRVEPQTVNFKQSKTPVEHRPNETAAPVGKAPEALPTPVGSHDRIGNQGVPNTSRQAPAAPPMAGPLASQQPARSIDPETQISRFSTKPQSALLPDHQKPNQLPNKADVRRSPQSGPINTSTRPVSENLPVDANTAQRPSDSAIELLPINAPVPTAAPNVHNVRPENAPPLPAPLQVVVSHSETAARGPVEIRLSPEELGHVRMQIETRDGAVTLSLQAERAETADLFRRNSNLLAEELALLGFGDLTFHFSHGGQQDSAKSERQTDGLPPTLNEPETNPEAGKRNRTANGLDIVI